MDHLKQLNKEIQELENSLSKDEIAISQAINKFSSLLNSFQEDNDNDDISYKETWSVFSKELYRENMRIKERSNNLNKIILLLELGMRFSDDELRRILAE
ncbi:hypothetical protein HN014_22175 (plasmid) [Aquimarina sp. TRL1]|uniref:hypothetical protein n=1 Tax=Aquimarina sp. (strain TRL1) TaxID=2736252 RepID=UPI00158AC519|nr:hypothetical protein [Aquimarina sp. TRL1]QKX07709.1 hypothetical protein HN014_22175 [Aquimarina sp. TRL1]